MPSSSSTRVSFKGNVRTRVPRPLPHLIGGRVEAFSQRAARHAGIMLLPSTTYGTDDRHLRFGLGRRNLVEGWNASSECLARDRAPKAPPFILLGNPLTPADALIRPDQLEEAPAVSFPVGSQTLLGQRQDP